MPASGHGGGHFLYKKASHIIIHIYYPFDLSSMCLRGLERYLTTVLYLLISQ